MTPEPQVLTRVKKLLRLAESPNAHEAALAAAKAQQLIDEYHLSTTLLALDGADTTPDEPIEDFGRKGAPLYSSGHGYWETALAIHLARVNGCKTYRRGKQAYLIGRASDAETVRYLFSYLRAQVEHLTAEAGRGCGRVWRNNFKLGIVQTISERLKDQHETFEREARATAAAEGTTALVRVNTALAAMEAKTATVEAWTKEHMRLGTGRPSYFHEDGHARAAGRAAGHRVHLGGRARGALGSGQRQLN